MQVYCKRSGQVGASRTSESEPWAQSTGHCKYEPRAGGRSGVGEQALTHHQVNHQVIDRAGQLGIGGGASASGSPSLPSCGNGSHYIREAKIIVSFRRSGEISVCCFFPLSFFVPYLSLLLSLSLSCLVSFRSLLQLHGFTGLLQPWSLPDAVQGDRRRLGVGFDGELEGTSPRNNTVGRPMIGASLRGEKSRASHEQIFPNAKEKDTSRFLSATMGIFLSALPAVPPSGGAWEAAKGKGDGSSSPSASGGLS